MNNRCECYRTTGDPTGENAVLCNAPAEYCPVCEKTVCGECHSEMATGQCAVNKKLPARAAQTDNTSATHRRA
jgi:hypothetical protein